VVALILIKVKIFFQKSGRPFIKGILIFFKKAVALLLVGFQKSGCVRFYHS
jgi:hypothetical protein